MDKKQFDVLVFIGRFQPFHNGHKEVIDDALELSKKVIVLCGSANRSRDTRNPFVFEERAQMIHEHYNYDERIVIRPLNDIKYNDVKWVKQVQDTVADEVLLQIPGNTEEITLSGYKDIKVGLIGCKKDGTSYYLNLFPNWKSVNVEHIQKLDGTALRQDYFEKGMVGLAAKAFPTSTAKFLNRFYETDLYRNLVDEYNFNNTYSTEQHNYPIKDTTADAAVIQSGHILLVKRAFAPGKGLWAMPGGHINEYETFEDAMLRELKEETKLKVPEKVLRGSIVKSDIFDDPTRSNRGRVITKAYLIKLEDGPLPRVYGSDDAEKAQWVALNELSADRMFEDHYDIIQNLIGG